MLIGASNASQLYPLDLLPAVNELITMTDDGSAGMKGMITDVLCSYVEKADQIFICGPAAMYKTIYDMENIRQLKKRIQLSLEARMGCGTGICYGCGIKTTNGMQTVCHDGPVFSLDEIILQEGNYDGSK
jgi:dihydroorotate dehydrogenase electron transfer subunit